jgi:hypothetical protein
MSVQESVEKLLADAQREADAAQYCLNCKHSWLHKLTGHGHCKKVHPGQLCIYPKGIKEFDTCPMWELKAKQASKK